LSQQGENSGQVLKEFQLTEDAKSKLDFSWGKKIAQYISSTTFGTTSHYFLRNNRIRLNRNLANGRVDVQAMFGDRLDYNGKTNYTNINWKAPAIISTAISRKIGQYMRRLEKINVKAVDGNSTQARKEKEAIARFYFENKQELANMQQASGVQLVPKDQFVAEDKDELDEWCMQFNRLPEEIEYEIGVNIILEQNGFYDTIKEKLLNDSCVAGYVGTYTFMDKKGTIHTEWLDAENLIYSYSKYNDFRDTSWRGHISSMKVSELRAKYGVQFGGKLTEEEIFQIAQTAKEWQVLDKITWVDIWNSTIFRPYDEWNIDVINFELRSLDKDYITVTKTKQNGSTLINKGVPKKVKENQEIIDDTKWNIYKGVYAKDSQVMLEWGIKDNMIRPNDPREMGNARFSYCIYMYNNYNMRNLAIPEKIEQPVEGMILAVLQIQKLIANMIPAGAAIDVDAVQELNLGLEKMTTALEGERIQRQTGRLYYRGRDAEGNKIPVPITEMANNGFAGQMESLIKTYQFYYQVLKDQLGEDPNLSNQAIQPRVTEGNVQTAMQTSADATDYLYDAYLYIMEETAKNVSCLLNDSVTFGAKAYRYILKEEDVKGRFFSTELRMLPTDQEIAELRQMLQTATASNPQFAIYCDQFKILRIAKEDVKLADLYYRQAMKRMIKDQQEIAQKNAEQNAQIQQASAQAKAQMDAQLMQQELQMKGSMEDNLSKNRKEELVISGFMQILSKGLPIPKEWQGIESEIIGSIGTELFHQNQAAVAAESQAAQMQQQSQQQSPQEEGMEQQQGMQEPQQQEQMEQPQQQVA
jgi:hypothetical protein